MAICPDHGGYTGDACKKCQTKPNLLAEAEKAKVAEIVGGPPKLDKDDQFTLMKLENDALKSFHKMQNAQAQLQNFVNGMFGKYEVKNSEYTLDVERMEFVLRGM